MTRMFSLLLLMTLAPARCLAAGPPHGGVSGEKGRIAALLAGLPEPDALDTAKIPVTTSTTLPTWGGNRPALAHDGDLSTFFWAGKAPEESDYFVLRLEEPRDARSIRVTTGKPDGGDTLRAGVLEVSTDGRTYREAARFDAGEARATGEIRGLRAVRVRPTGKSGKWLAIREIQIDNLALGESGLVRFTREIPEYGITLTLQANMTGCDDLEYELFVRRAAGLFFEHYARIAAIIDSPLDTLPRAININIRSGLNVPAYSSGNAITVQKEWIKERPEDSTGMFIHELTHIVQHYPSYDPFWVVEGGADYVRYKIQPDSAWARGQRVDPDRSDFRKNGYGVAALFILWIEENYDKKFLRKISGAVKRGVYKESLVKDITGKELDALWEEYKASLRAPAPR